jgi:IclR family transcriptional regulator, pca regulon regulatory protein
MPRYFVYALEKGLAVLEAFNNQNSALGLSEIAKLTHMNLPSTTRYLRTLTDLGYLHFDPDVKRYSLTPRVLSLGFTVLNNMDLRKRLYPYMLRLNRKYDVILGLAILQDTEIVYIERIIGSSFSNLDHKVGTRLPVYCTSLGHCLLSHMDSDRAENIIAQLTMKKLSSHTITDKSRLCAELKRCRQRGYAITSQQLSLGWFNAVVPILMGEQVEGALGISYPMNFFEDQSMADKLLEDLIRAGKEASYDGRGQTA